MNKSLWIAAVGFGAKVIILAVMSPQALVAAVFAGFLGALLGAVSGTLLGVLAPEGRGPSAARLVLDGVGASLVGAMLWLKLGDTEVEPWLPLIWIGGCFFITLFPGLRGEVVDWKSVLVRTFALGSGAVTLPWFFVGLLPATEVDTPLLLLSLAALVTSGAMLLADFNGSHLENPRWPPHARFHSFWFILMSCCLGLFSLYALWHPAMSTVLSRHGVALIQVLIWGPVFLAWAAPRTSIWPDGMRARTFLNGNVILAALVLGFCAAAWRPAESGARELVAVASKRKVP